MTVEGCPFCGSMRIFCAYRYDMDGVSELQSCADCGLRFSKSDQGDLESAYKAYNDIVSQIKHYNNIIAHYEESRNELQKKLKKVRKELFDVVVAKEL